MTPRPSLEHPDDLREEWWVRFFESTDSLELSHFPNGEETNREVRGLIKLLSLTREDCIADVCCGWGRHLLRLVRRGYQVTGLDSSEMMLTIAQRLLVSEGLSAPLVRGDAARLPFADAAFDVVLNLFNSFGYFLAEGENLQVLRETARVLKPGGRFLLDTRNRQFQILYAPYCQQVCTSDGRALVLRCRYDRARSRLDSFWSLPDDPAKVVHHASIRLYGLNELRGMMAAAGFEELGVYGTYQGEPFEGFHRQLLYVARRTA